LSAIYRTNNNKQNYDEIILGNFFVASASYLDKSQLKNNGIVFCFDNGHQNLDNCNFSLFTALHPHSLLHIACNNDYDRYPHDLNTGVSIESIRRA
jgi:hypothetical protein